MSSTVRASGYTWPWWDSAMKARWVSALRSGEYKQANGFTCEGRGTHARHDVMGVLYEEEFDGDWHPDPDPDLEADVWLTSEWALWVSSEMAFRPGLTTWQLESVGLTQVAQRQLVKMSDKGMSFDGLADWIEARL